MVFITCSSTTETELNIMAPSQESVVVVVVVPQRVLAVSGSKPREKDGTVVPYW